MDSTRTIGTVVAALAGVVLLASGASASSSAPVRPVVRSSSPKKSPVRAAAPKAKPKGAPQGDVTLGPITLIKTDPKTGAKSYRTDTASLTSKERAAYNLSQSANGVRDSELLTDEQADALEDRDVQAARAGMPGASSAQQEAAKRAALRARQVLSRKGVPRIPNNPTIDTSSSDDDDGDEDAPKAYVSPPTPINLEVARREAPALAKHLRAKGQQNYSRQSLRSFQGHAGITVDGIYGPLAASALRYFGVANPPQPFFKPAPGTITIYAPTN